MVSVCAYRSRLGAEKKIFFPGWPLTSSHQREGGRERQQIQFSLSQ